jgi:hypothetical protein
MSLTKVDPLGPSHAGPGDSLYAVASDRFGFGVNPAYGQVGDFAVAQLRGGWYVDWRTRLDPAYPAGLDYMHIIHTEGDIFSPDLSTLAAIARANPGMTWIIGNEPDCVWQGNSTPDQYVTTYRQLYTFLRDVDPNCRVTIGGIVQATPLRMQWLDAVLDTYQARYGEPFPVDLWNIHTFILQEKSCVVYPHDCWGCEIPPGISARKGVEWGLDEHDYLPYIEEQIVRFRQWMQARGERDKELIVSEYGILMPDSYGYDASRVEAFMIGTFDYFLTATDHELGCPADGSRLVQRWAWYSLNDKRFEGYTSHSHLFDPNTKMSTALGIAFRDYLAPLYGTYVDVLPAALETLPSQPLALDGQPITITLTTRVRNAGNVDATDTSVLFWVDDPVQLLGSAQTIAALPARSLDNVSVVWPNVAAGVYTVGVTVDAGDMISESNEENNQSAWSLLVAGYAIHLPLVARGK